MEPSRDGAFRRGCRRSAGHNVGIFASAQLQTRTDQSCTSKGSGSKNLSSTLASSREILLS